MHIQWHWRHWRCAALPNSSMFHPIHLTTELINRQYETANNRFERMVLILIFESVRIWSHRFNRKISFGILSIDELTLDSGATQPSTIRTPLGLRVIRARQQPAATTFSINSFSFEMMKNRHKRRMEKAFSYSNRRRSVH